MADNQLPSEHILAERRAAEADAVNQQEQQAQTDSPAVNEPDDEAYASLREQILNEVIEEQAFEQFQQDHPEVWLQVKRLNKVVELQEDYKGGIFPSGSCFIHANTPDYQTFCVKRILEIDLESSLVIVEIHGDDELRDGVVMLPLEVISWYGFPSETVKMESHIRGFQAGMAGKNSKKQP